MAISIWKVTILFKGKLGEEVPGVPHAANPRGFFTISPGGPPRLGPGSGWICLTVIGECGTTNASWRKRWVGGVEFWWSKLSPCFFQNLQGGSGGQLLKSCLKGDGNMCGYIISSLYMIYIYIMYIRYICCIVRFSVTQNVFDRPFSTKL